MSDVEDDSERQSGVCEPRAESSGGGDTAAPAPPPRSIVALLGGQPRPAPTAAKAVTSKRRRKNADKPSGPQQGRIVLNAPGSAAWGVGVGRRDDEDTESVGSGAGPSGKGKGRAAPKAGDGEEQELREMNKRAKSTRGRDATGRGRGGRKNGKAGGVRPGEEDESDDDYCEERQTPGSLSTTSGPGGPTPSPRKKRGRPKKGETQPAKSRKSTRSASTARGVSPEYAVIPSSSPNDVMFTGQSGQTKTNGSRKHPPFSRVNTGSNASLKGASQQDAIDVEAGQKSGPKKIAFASDAKPAHAFFSRLNQAPSSRATSVTSDRTAVDPGATASSALGSDPPTPVASAFPQGATGTQTEPNGKQAKAPGKAVHSFFQSNGSAPKPGVLKNGWGGGVKEGQEWMAPWPGQFRPEHEREGPEPSQAGPSIPRRQRSENPVQDDGVFWQSVMSSASIQSPVHRDPRSGRKSVSSSRSRETLCDRFRPRRASQVLGNTTEATYLRDWLSALSVGNHENDGPKVMRRLPKRRPKLDDWIVDDIGPNGLPDWIEEWDGDEVPEPYEEPDLPLGQRPDSYAPLSMRLANSILLTGPSGSGKSAAVYAAATELGWEVFEVYPGIGKRTGGNLMSLVGDVGKNHMVGKGKEKEKEAASNGVPGIKSFLQPQADDDKHEGQGSGSGEPVEVDDNHPDRPVTPPPRLRNSSVHSTPFRDEAKFRQSLILIEEVDILFEEESTFWPAVIALIAESRRPVVMTCNDARNCPFDALPLQSVLQFEPPQREKAVAYLSSLCTELGVDAEGREAYVQDLYDRSIVRHSGLLDGPGPPNGHEWLPNFDLRRAIMQLQLERGEHKTGRMTNTAPSADLRELARELDKQSYVDAHVDRRAWAVMEVNELDRYQPTLDDQLGVRTVLKPELPDEIPILPAYDRTSDIVSSLTFTPTSSGTSDLLTDQIKYIRTLLPLLDPIIPLSSYLLPHPTLFTDYMPSIRTMIHIDDVRQAGYDAAKAAGEDVRNYKTGRPMRVTAWLGKEGFTRQLELDDQALVVGRQELRY